MESQSSSRPSPRKTRRAQTDIGENLAAWRKLQGLTAQQVAERAGISRSTLSRLEHGRTPVSFEAFLEFSEREVTNPTEEEQASLIQRGDKWYRGEEAIRPVKDFASRSLWLLTDIEFGGKWLTRDRAE